MQVGRQRPGFPEVIGLQGGLSGLTDLELLAAVVAIFYLVIIKQDGEVPTLLSSFLNMSMLSLSFMYLYITFLEEVCGISCCVEIGIAGEDQAKW